MLKHKRGILIAALVALLALGGVGATLTWLFVGDQAQNDFSIAQVSSEVQEKFKEGGTIKTDVSVKNSSNIPTYIRVALVPVWRDAEGNGTGLNAADTYDLTLNLSPDGWFQDGDYYYYKKPVPAGGSSAILVNSCSPKSNLAPAYAGQRFELQVICSAVQADPKAAVEYAWGKPLADKLSSL